MILASYHSLMRYTTSMSLGIDTGQERAQISKTSCSKSGEKTGGETKDMAAQNKRDVMPLMPTQARPKHGTAFSVGAQDQESPPRSRSQGAASQVIGPSSINAGIKADHLAEGFMPAHREKRKNHKSVEKLLAVPRYRDLLEDQDNEEEGERGRALVSSVAGWRTDLEETEEPDDNSDTPPTASTSRLPPPKTRKWVKMTLKVLFGGAAKPVRKFTEEEIDHEADLMAALADAEEDARPDDGAIECDDDDVYVP
ncbi:hypothetical protein B0H10DRAFT_2314556 [Mycena sp. CBHHK59/15]|nr:hypothetical protein B0H10DRAFT_2314556 [Mycena sp. CBHHK59/15]